MNFQLFGVIGATVTLSLTGCLVDSNFCIQDSDCLGGEICARNSFDYATSSCQLPECRTDLDCWRRAGVPTGMTCVTGRCTFAGGADRLRAPDFCLEVVNPKSVYHGQVHCLSTDQGKVRLVFFGLLA